MRGGGKEVNMDERMGRGDGNKGEIRVKIDGIKLIISSPNLSTITEVLPAVRAIKIVVNARY